MNHNKKLMCPDSVFTFGKYKGKSLEYISHKDPCYIGWAIQAGVIDLTDKVLEARMIYEYQQDRIIAECTNPND